MNETLPLVSIITGYYNRTANLKECVQSILNQTYENFEYIIFDDCSTDGTYELLMEFDDPRLKVIRHEKNLGFTKGIINAIAQSSGEFIAVHGAGDFSYPERIKKQVDYLVNNPEVGIVSSDREEVSNHSVTKNINKDSNIDFKKGILYRNFIVHGDVMFRKGIYDIAGGYDPLFVFAQDRDLWVRMRGLCKFHRLPEVLYRRPFFEDSVSHNLKRKIQQRFLTCLSRERNLKDRNFSLLFRDKYQVVADEALILHYKHRTNPFRPHLLEVCREESWSKINKLYYYLHAVPFINRKLFRIAQHRMAATTKFLDGHYRTLEDMEIYEIAVLGKKYKY